MFTFSDNDRWEILQNSFNKNAKSGSLIWMKKANAYNALQMQ